MKLRTGLILTLFYLVQCVQAQNAEEVLFTIEGEPVYSSEFLRAYEKNKDIVIDKEQKDFDDYFELFLDFKLKLRQAKDMHLDTLTKYREELSQYREQLIQPYLQNPEAIDLLTREAYERTLWEVRASHILIMLAPDAKAVDTLAAWNLIGEARREALKSDSFAGVAKKYSQDPSVKDNGGDLGYFGAFAMVYPFENAAYRTAVGEISQPFRTQFGYHIVKVQDRRRSPGEVQVSHIMVKKDSSQPGMAREKILDIRQKLLEGDDFAKIAMAHSDDAASASRGGQLPKFGTGKMIKGFDQAAFALQTEGEISQPFETQYGWHILKLDKKFPVAPYEELRPKLETRVKNGSRSAVVERSLALKFSEIYAVQRNSKPLQTVASLNELDKVTDTLLLIEDKAYTGKEFAAYVSGHPRNSTDQLFAQFCDDMLIAYHKEHLEEHNEDFALTFREYEDGLLLFELLQRMVWDRSEQDSLKMADFFQANRDRYVWKRRGDVTIASCTRKDKALRVRELMLEGRETGEIKELVNEGTQVHVLFSNARLEEGSSRLPENFKIALGVSEVHDEGESHFVVYRVEEIYDPQPKELYEARGEVVNDFQNYLEEQWVADLRASYEVNIDKRNYAKLKKRVSVQ